MYTSRALVFLECFCCTTVHWVVLWSAPLATATQNVPRRDGLLAVLPGLVRVLARVEVSAGRVSRSPLSLLFEFYLLRLV